MCVNQLKSKLRVWDEIDLDKAILEQLLSLDPSMNTSGMDLLAPLWMGHKNPGGAYFLVPGSDLDKYRDILHRLFQTINLPIAGHYPDSDWK